MRVLLIDEEAKSKIKAVRDFAEMPRNYYIVGKGGFTTQRPPGDDPRHVCKLTNGFRCVFSMTVADETLWRPARAGCAATALRLPTAMRAVD